MKVQLYVVQFLRASLLTTLPLSISKTQLTEFGPGGLGGGGDKEEGWRGKGIQFIFGGRRSSHNMKIIIKILSFCIWFWALFVTFGRLLEQ